MKMRTSKYTVGERIQVRMGGWTRPAKVTWIDPTGERGYEIRFLDVDGDGRGDGWGDEDFLKLGESERH